MRILIAASLLIVANAQERPRITGVAHVAFYVSDLDNARAFYKDLLGYEEPFSLANPEIAFIKINDRQYVELSKEKAPNTDRLNHVSLETDDIVALRNYLAAKGVKVPAAPSKVRIGNLAMNVTDPDGHTVELVQYMPDGKSVTTRGKFAGPDRISDRMAHFGILVGNVEASMKFYRDTLGLVETWRGSSNPDRLSWINMRVPDGDDYIEFMLYDKLPDEAKRGSQHHICLFVPDINAALKTVQSRTEKAHYTRPLEPKTGINRKRQLNLFDPDGSRVELMEPVTIDGKPAASSTAPPPHS